MKLFSFSARRPRAGFTLIELLVVIAIIGILAAMLLAVLPGVTNATKRTKAKLEAQSIATAIEQYDSAYGRFPVSAQAQNAAAGLTPPGDFTYGGTFQDPTGSAFTIWNTSKSRCRSDQFRSDCDSDEPDQLSERFGSTINTNYQKNPQKTIFLNAKMSGWDGTGTPQPGVGNDLVYRDPWGNPYIISMDLNYDDQTRDAFYGLSAVSGPANPGLNGLVNPDNSLNNFQYHGKVMVWSAGSADVKRKTRFRYR